MPIWQMTGLSLEQKGKYTKSNQYIILKIKAKEGALV
jgi:hypothetical protein